MECAQVDGPSRTQCRMVSLRKPVPNQVEDRNNTRMTLSQPRFFRAPGIYEDFVCIQNYRCLAWVMWDADTTAALQLGSVETTTSQMPPPVLQLVNLAKSLGKNPYERFLESTGKIKYSPLQLYDLGRQSGSRPWANSRDSSGPKGYQG